MPGIRNWWDLTAPDFLALSPERCIAVLPVGAVEQHGPHLPVGVDSQLCQAVVGRVAATVADDLDVLLLPLQPVGTSNEHQAFAGTLSLSVQTLTQLWLDIGDSIARAGVRKMLLLNSHGGQVQTLDIVARELRVRHRMFAVTASIGAFAPEKALFPDEELRHGIHGGAVETSMMLHLHPALVRPDKIADFRSASQDIELEYRYLRPEGAAVGFGWQIQDLHVEGACGNALDSDAQRGALLIDSVVSGVLELLREISRFPLASLRD